MSKKYAAFMSYSHRDQKAANWLHKRIETYRLPKGLRGKQSEPSKTQGQLSPIFKDREELPSAPSLSKIINQALEDSAFLIVVCSPSAAKSEWVNAEILEFKMHHGDERVLAYIVDGEPNATDPQLECFPPALLKSVGPHGENPGKRLEPVAADARRHADTPGQASLKIIAGLLGVGFDRLRQRETQRKNKRLLMITTTATLGFVLASGLAINAILARNEAQQQRERAEISARTAKRTSDFLVDAFQLAGPNEAQGRSVTAVEILDRSVASIENLQSEPQIQTALMHSMGEAYTGLGLYTQAAELLTNATEIQQTNKQFESTAATQTALAEALMYSGELEQATTEIRKAQEQLEPLPWSPLSSEATNLSGDILVLQGNAKDAEAYYQDALAKDREAAANNTQSPAQLARSETGLATALIYQGRFDEAEPLLLASLDHYLIALGTDHPKVATTYNNLASLYYFNQDWPGVTANYAKAEPLYRKLYGEEHPEFALVLNNYGRVELENGDLSKAHQLLQETANIYKNNTEADHTEALLFALNSLGLAHIASGEFVKATELLQEASTYLKDKHRLGGQLMVNRAWAACALKENSLGINYLEVAQPMLSQHYKSDDWRFAIASAVEQSCLSASQRNPEKLAAAIQQLRETKGDKNLLTRLAQVL